MKTVIIIFIIIAFIMAAFSMFVLSLDLIDKIKERRKRKINSEINDK